MSNSLQIKRFDYGQEDLVNEFIKTVDLPANGAIHFRDNGIIVVHTEKRTHFGLTKQEHIDGVKDEIGRAEAELADALVQHSETSLGFRKFNGKSGMKKIADAFLKQMAQDADTIDNKTAKLQALKSLLEEVESGRILIGNDAVVAHMEAVASTPVDPIAPKPENTDENLTGAEETQAA